MAVRPVLGRADKHFDDVVVQAVIELSLEPPLELGMIEIQRLVVPCPTMRCPERLRFGPRLEHSPVFPDGVGGVERMILSLWTFEKVKLSKARHLVEMTVTRHPNMLESCFGPLGYTKAVHGDKHYRSPDNLIET